MVVCKKHDTLMEGGNWKTRQDYCREHQMVDHGDWDKFRKMVQMHLVDTVYSCPLCQGRPLRNDSNVIQ